jgi:hypothetical protein
MESILHMDYMLFLWLYNILEKKIPNPKRKRNDNQKTQEEAFGSPTWQLLPP